MSLSYLEKRLTRTLGLCGLDAETAWTAFTGLETERQQWMMLDWMNAYYDETGAYPKEESIAKALGLIRQLTGADEGADEKMEQDTPSA